MTVTNMNNQVMRFFGRIKHPGNAMDNEPVILLSLETEGKPEFSKILFHTRIRDGEMRDELLRLVMSDRVQKTANVKLWEVLQRATFTNQPNKTMFSVLYGMDVIRDYPKDRLVVEAPNGDYPSVQRVIDDIKQCENAKLLKQNGVEQKLVAETYEREAKVNGKLNEFEDRLGKMEGMLSKMVEMQEALMRGTSVAKPSGKKSTKVLRDEPVVEEAPTPVVEETPVFTADEFDAGLPPRAC